MLLLTRRRGEAIMIGDQVSIRVVHIGRGQVTIGVHAPIDVPVHREEVYVRIKTGTLRARAGVSDVKHVRR